MAELPTNAGAPSEGKTPRPYVVVARRYRPQNFAELIGQEHVAQALSNAIASHRVGHAYLFTGARGVGKTSAARILAKALNCEHGPSPVPCNQCDICRSISTGEDVDVLEIDGASNRGIDEIRQLRQNTGVRPSRARFKIYIIDEVHMLTREAFNALLKTLEEPPEHVKFIFCTTEPTKIPITILSRCQRFDFAGILTGSIQKRLQQIVEAEGVEAEPEALEILARRAAGSMRDSQSLLEQLLAFAPGRITVADVHGMLGTAGEQRLAVLVDHLIDRNAAAALAELDAAMNSGVDPAQLIEQLFGYLRDCMVAAVGCPSETFLYTSPSAAEQVAAASQRLGLDTLLAVMQILDQTLSRMRYSTQGRILAELALVRISHLEDLTALADVIAQLQSGVTIEPSPAPTRSALPAAKKKWTAAIAPPREKADPVDDGEPEPPASDSPRAMLSAENATAVWSQALDRMSGMIVDQARHFDSVAASSSNRLVIRFKSGYALFKSACERPEQVARFEHALADVTGQRIHVEFGLTDEPTSESAPAASAQTVLPHQRILEVMQHPMVSRAGELFGAQPTRVDEPTNHP
ncbi:MAG: DNA polymerase III subunit gamma/tau [Thermoguttaceae bacterium]